VTTIALLRQTYANRNLGRADGLLEPWTDGDVDQHLAEAIRQTWPLLGKRANGTVATNQASDVYTVPAALSATDFRISRIELEYSSGGQTKKVDEVKSWQLYSDTQIRIRPLLATDASAVLRVFGWIPFLADASDLPVRLEVAIAARAVGLCFGQLASKLVNSERQQGLEDGRVVDYQTAVGLSAYWERRYFEQADGDPAKISVGPRAARR